MNSEWLKKQKKCIDEDLKNPNGYFAKEKKRSEILNSRFDKFERWLKKNEFDPYFKKLLERNGEDRLEWCYRHGYEKYGTPLMEFLVSYVSTRKKHRINKKINSDFEAGLWYFKGYWFQSICGQGCFWRIYDKDLNVVEDV